MSAHDYTQQQAFEMLMSRLREKDLEMAGQIQAVVDAGKDVEETELSRGRRKRSRSYRKTVPYSYVRELSAKFPGSLAKLIEDKANGSAVIQMLSREIPGILPVNPEGGKVARAAAVSPLIEAGNIYLPHPLHAPWVNDFIEECAAFPNGAHDDQVDAMTQALLRWNMVPKQTVIVYDAPCVISPI